jgi:hypothetical protein
MRVSYRFASLPRGRIFSLKFFEFLKKDVRIGYDGFVEINPRFMVHSLPNICRLCINTKNIIWFLVSVFVFRKNNVPEIGSFSSLGRRGGEGHSLFLRIRRANVHIWTLECDSYYVGSNQITSCFPILPPENRKAFSFLRSVLNTGWCSNSKTMPP